MNKRMVYSLIAVALFLLTAFCIQEGLYWGLVKFAIHCAMGFVACVFLARWFIPWIEEGE